MTRQEEFEYESLQDVESIVEHLDAVIGGFRRGQLLLAANGKGVELHPAGLLRLVVEAKRGKHRSRLAIRMSWREHRGETEHSSEPLRINAEAT